MTTIDDGSGLAVRAKCGIVAFVLLMTASCGGETEDCGQYDDDETTCNAAKGCRYYTGLVPDDSAAGNHQGDVCMLPCEGEGGACPDGLTCEWTGYSAGVLENLYSCRRP